MNIGDPRVNFMTENYEKHFLEEKYNLTAEYCLNIEQHTNDSIYSEIENEVCQEYLVKSYPNIFQGGQFQQHHFFN